MLSRSGFGWKNWDKNKIYVDSDDVWDNYVKDNKDAGCYRYKVLRGVRRRVEQHGHCIVGDGGERMKRLSSSTAMWCVSRSESLARAESTHNLSTAIAVFFEETAAEPGFDAAMVGGNLGGIWWLIWRPRCPLWRIPMRI